MSSSSSFNTGAGLQDVQGTTVTETGQIYKSNVSYNMSDHGAINTAIDLVEDVLVSFGEDYTGLVSLESENNRQFLGQGVNRVLDQSGEVNHLIAGAATGIAKFVKKEAEANRYFLGQATGQVFEQASDALNSAIAQANNAIKFTEGQADANRSFLGQATSEVFGAYNEFINSLDGALDKTFSLVGGSQSNLAASHKNSLESVTEFAKSFLTSSDVRNNNNLKVLSDAARSDSAKALDKIIYLAGGVIVVVAGLAFLKR